MSDSTIQSIRQALDDASQILVTTHIGPDGDAIGSLTAMGLMLQKLGKFATLVSEDGVPKRFKYLPLTDTVLQRPLFDEKYDLIITLDAGDPSRVGNVLANLPEPLPCLINIDHHVTNTNFGNINLVDLEVGSTTEILFNILPQLGIPLNAALAECLLTGLVTDTLNFRTANVTGQTLKVSSELVNAGVNLHHVTTQALTLKDLSSVFLWQKGLNNAKVEDEGIIWTVITKEERQELGHHGYSTNGLGNLLTDVYGIKMSAVILEQANGRVIVSFRCQPPYNVSEIATELGGGGHHLAAGCTIHAPIKEATALVVSKSKEAMRRQKINLQYEG